MATDRQGGSEEGKMTYTTHINIGTHLTAEWKIDRKFKTLEQAQAREKLLLEHYEVMILEN